MAELTDQVDTERLHQARCAVKQAIADALEAPLLVTYQACQNVTGADSHQLAATRALKNTCLNYLALRPQHLQDLVQQQYQSATNMTEQLGALKAANQQDSEVREHLMQSFELQWKDTPLVMDKWFALQATLPSAQTLDRIQKLMQHQSFTMNNPNRVRALLVALLWLILIYFMRKMDRVTHF